MNTRKFFVAFLATCPFIAFSQTSDFDLASYKLPYMMRNSLDFSLNADNSYKKYNYDEMSNLSGSGKASLDYAFYLNSEKVQNSTYVSTSGYFVNSTKELNGYSMPLKSYEVNRSSQILTYNRYYFDNSFFLETDLDAYANIYDMRNDYVYNNGIEFVEYTTKTKAHSSSIELPIKIGKGRIERVEDARLAVYILNDLKKLGIVTDTISSTNILVLAKAISLLKNKTVFDSRLSRIENITALDSILQSLGIVRKANAAYFTSIADNWVYSNGPIRESGYRLSFGFSPYYLEAKANGERIEQGISQNNIDNQYISTFKVFGEYNYCKPLNLFWQFNLKGSVGFAKTTVNNVVEKKFNFYYLSLSPELGYYPNSRTSISYNSTYSYNLNADEPTGNNRKYEFVMNHTFSLNYYISPKLTVQASETLFFRTPQSVSQDYYYYSDDSNNKFSHLFNIGFYYKFM